MNRGKRAKSSISGSDLYSALQLSSYDPLSFIQQLYSDFVLTSSFIMTLEKLFVKPVVEIVSVFSIKRCREQREYSLVSSCTLVTDFSGRWSQHKLAEDQSLLEGFHWVCIYWREIICSVVIFCSTGCCNFVAVPLLLDVN